MKGGENKNMKSKKTSKTKKIEKVEEKVQKEKPVRFIVTGAKTKDSYFRYAFFEPVSETYGFSTKEKLLKWLENECSNPREVEIYSVGERLSVKGNFELVLK